MRTRRCGEVVVSVTGWSLDKVKWSTERDAKTRSREMSSEVATQLTDVRVQPPIEIQVHKRLEGALVREEDVPHRFELRHDGRHDPLHAQCVFLAGRE